MAYRHDSDLEFMDRASHDDLKNLVYVLIYDPQDGKTRWTQELTSKLKGCSDHHFRWHEIAGELQCFGGNTFANLMRGGKGVSYRELLCDICDVLKLQYDKNEYNIENIEDILLNAQMKKIWENWSFDARKYYLLIARLYCGDFRRYGAESLSSFVRSSSLPFFISSIFGTGGIMSLLLAQTVSGLTIASLTGVSFSTLSGLAGTAFAAMAPRFIGFLVPPAAILSALSLSFSLSGPAYRVTLPGCLAVAELRKKVAIGPREILKMQKKDEIIREMQEYLKKYAKQNTRLANLYIFGYKVMEYLNIDAYDDLRQIIEGFSGTLIMVEDKINSSLRNLTLNQAYDQVIHDGQEKERLVSLINMISYLGDDNEAEMNRLLNLLGLNFEE